MIRRLELARPIPNLPPAIVAAYEACDLIVTEPWRFRGLQFAHLSRARRIERRLSICLTMKAELCRMDLRTWRVGRLHDDRIHLVGIPVATLGSWTGLEYNGPAPRPRGAGSRALARPKERRPRGRRVERALADAMRAGYQTGKRDRANRLRAPQPIDDYETVDGRRRFRGCPAVRHFSPKLFREMGVLQKMEIAQKKAAKEHEVKLAAEKTEAAARAAAELGTVVRRAVKVEPIASDDGRLAELTLALQRAHPTWSLPEVREEARRRLAAATGPPE